MISPRPTRWLTTLPLVALLFMARAQTPCEPYPGGGSLHLEGIGVAEFAQVTVEGGRERLTLSAGVCVAFEGPTPAVLRADQLRLWRSESWNVTATEVAIELPDLRLTGEGVVLVGEQLLVERATLEGEALAGVASQLALEWKTGEWSAEEVRLATPVGWWDAARAHAVPGGVRFEEAWFSTCDCPPGTAPARIEGVWLEVAFEPFRMTVAAGEWVSPLGRVQLPALLTLNAESWAKWLPQIGITTNGGVTTTWSRRSLAPGVTAAASVASGWPSGDGAVALDLQAAMDERALSVRAREDRLRLQWSERWPLGDDWWLNFGQVLEFADRPARFADTVMQLSRSWQLVSLPAALTEVSGSLNLGVAVTAIESVAATQAGSRLGLASMWRIRAAPLAGVTPWLAIGAGVSAYPQAEATQSWVEVQPGLEWQAGGTRLNLDHRARWVSGGSPFGVAVDGVLPLQQTRFDLRSSHSWDAGGSLDAGLVVVVNSERTRDGDGVRFRVETLAPRLELRSTYAGAALAASFGGELAGWTRSEGSRPARSLSARLRVTATPAWGSLELAVRGDAGKPAVRSLTLAVGAEPTGYRWSVALAADPWRPEPRESLELRSELALTGGEWTVGIAAAWRPWSPEADSVTLRFGVELPWLGAGVAWRPSFEIDVGALVRAESRSQVWRAYGVDLAWATRLGTVDVGIGYRHDQGTSVRLGLSLPSRPVDLLPVLASQGVPLRSR